MRFRPGAVTLPPNQTSPVPISTPTYSPPSLEDSLVACGATELEFIADSWRVPTTPKLVSFSDIYVVVVPGCTDVPTMAARMQALAGVSRAEPAYGAQTFSIADPKYPDQWHLESTGQREALPDVDVDVEGAWESTLGAGTMVFVLDTGMAQGHHDLPGAPHMEWWCLSAGLQDSQDTSNHGTRVAGLVGARANSVGVRGVVPQTQLAILRLSAGRRFREDCCIMGLNFAYNQGARIVSNSWGRAVSTDVFAAAVRNTRLTGEDGSLIVVGAGNIEWNIDETTPTYPAAYENLSLAVSAVVKGGARWSGGVRGPWVDVCAPGGSDITTTSLMQDGYYTDEFGGTSAATPIASGIAALVLSLNAALTADDLSQIIRRTATDILPAGWDERFGTGLVNANRAVEFVSAPRCVVQGTLPRSAVETVEISEYYFKVFRNLGYVLGDPGLPDGPTSYLVKRHTMRGTATLGAPYLTSWRNAWVRAKDGLVPGWPDVEPLDCLWHIGWGTVDSTTWTSTQVTFETYTFALYEPSDTSFVAYVPIHPDSCEIPYTAVLGPFDDVPFVEVHSPNGGERWLGGVHEITWEFTDDDGRDSVSVYWSLDSGRSFRYQVATGVTADSSWTWTVTGQGAGSGSSRIAVIGHDRGGDWNYDMSDGDLFISSPGGGGIGEGTKVIDRRTGLEVDGHPWRREGGRIAFRLGATEHVVVDVFDVSGRRVRRLLDAVRDGGTHEVPWNLLDERGWPVASGAYFYRVAAGGQVSRGKIVVVR